MSVHSQDTQFLWSKTMQSKKLKPSDALKKIRWFWNRRRFVGICYNYEKISDRNLFNDMRESGVDFREWDEFSGSFYYPVPHNKLSPKYAYNKEYFLFSYLTSYGRRRRRLLAWLIKEFESKGA